MKPIVFSSTRKLVGKRMLYFSEIPSTSDWLKSRMGDCPPPSGTVVFTGNQTRGRGRFSRTWHHFRGNIATSILLCGLFPGNLPYPLWVGLALHNFLNEKYGLKTIIKWPNDLLYKDRKISGILCEGFSSTKGFNMILGIGINLYRSEQRLADMRNDPISLEEAGLRISCPFAFLENFLDELDTVFLNLLQNRTVFASAEWNQKCGLIGREILFKKDGQLKRGIMKGIDGKGNLMVSDASSTILCLNSGEIDLV